MAREVPLAHPGEILLKDWLEPLGLSQYALARAIGVPPRRINEIVKGLRGITVDTAHAPRRLLRNRRTELDQPADALRYRACARGDGRHDRKNSPLRSLARVKSETTLNSPRRGSCPLIAGGAKPV